MSEVIVRASGREYTINQHGQEDFELICSQTHSGGLTTRHFASLESRKACMETIDFVEEIVCTTLDRIY